MGNTAHVRDYLDGLIRVVGVVPDRVAVLYILRFGYHEETL